MKVFMNLYGYSRLSIRLFSSRLSSRLKRQPIRIEPTEGVQPIQPEFDITHPIELQANYSSITCPLSKILSKRDPSSVLLSNPLLVIGRQVELMNVFLGVEQQNRYTVRNVNGDQIGWIIEEDKGFVGVILRQLLRTRREFKADVTDVNGNVMLKIYRPIKWFLNSTITVSKPDGTEIGLVQSDWHLWRRRYDLFVQDEQIGRIDGGFWAWEFSVHDQQNSILSLVTRKFIGLVKEIFTDMGQYVVHFDSVSERNRQGSGLTLDERSVILASAISIDIDYFSRHSNSASSMGFFSSTPSE